ncbi:hypothetical protein Nepgr_018765 [Nepenthes gracilis]|uniref:Uncharacterized protein n=1 Tax=Nepenthes gracilis TaxID=150966 RepID=A0AAD3SUH8_NEPGR|nr:hypothetical protein Nepgr_018765 [Nepenthes gracilis]
MVSVEAPTAPSLKHSLDEGGPSRRVSKPSSPSGSKNLNPCSELPDSLSSGHLRPSPVPDITDTPKHRPPPKPDSLNVGSQRALSNKPLPPGLTNAKVYPMLLGGVSRGLANAASSVVVEAWCL